MELNERWCVWHTRPFKSLPFAREPDGVSLPPPMNFDVYSLWFERPTYSFGMLVSNLSYAKRHYWLGAGGRCKTDLSHLLFAHFALITTYPSLGGRGTTCWFDFLENTKLNRTLISFEGRIVLHCLLSVINDTHAFCLGDIPFLLCVWQTISQAKVYAENFAGLALKGYGILPYCGDTLRSGCHENM